MGGRWGKAGARCRVGSFLTVSEGVDVWFEPNPEAGRDRWFSGGVRRSFEWPVAGRKRARWTGLRLDGLCNCAPHESWLESVIVMGDTEKNETVVGGSGELGGDAQASESPSAAAGVQGASFCFWGCGGLGGGRARARGNGGAER